MAEIENSKVKDNITTAENIATITVKNADGDPDTVAKIIVQNKIDYTPKVSVIMPVYNVESYLRQCLDSVTQQTLQEIEIICVDDGSTDASLDILKEYAAKDNRITIIKQKNLCAGVARNAGLAVAKGEYLSFLDSDDFFELNMLEELYKKACEDDSDIVICGNYVYDQQKDEIVRQVHLNAKCIEASPFVPTMFTKTLFTSCNPNPWNKLFRHSLFDKFDLRYEKYMRCNDFTCVCSLMSIANKISMIDVPFITYRTNQKSSVSSNRTEHIDCFLYAADKLEKNMKRIGSYDKLSDACIVRLYSSLKWELANCNDQIIDKTQKQAKDILSPELYNELFGPKISVIIPVYNVEKYLRQCLDSAVNQTLKDIEIICVNDESPDNSLDILKEYAAKDDRIIIIDQKNQGLSCTRNNALKIAKGKYVLFLDSDDWIREDTCELLYNHSIRDNLDMLNFEGINYNNDTKECNQLQGQKIYYINNDKSTFDRAELLDIIYRIPISACRFFYRRKFLEDNNIRFPEGICFEDNYFVRKSLLFVQMYGVEREILYYRRVHSGSITQNRDRFFLDYLEVVRRVVNLYKDNDVEPEITERIKRNYCDNSLQQFKYFSPEYRVKYKHNIVSFLKHMDVYNDYKSKLNSSIEYGKRLAVLYKQRTKTALNLVNPRTFNEKMQWLKIYYAIPIKTFLSDKYLVRNWVKETIGEQYLIPLIGAYDRFEDINFDELPNKFVIKCNHGCAYNIIVKDKSQLDLNDVKEKLDTWMADDFSTHSFELHYRDIKRKIIIEKFIENKNSDELNDYKFYCFNGEVKYVQVISERINNSHKVSFYDMNWKKQDWWDNEFYEGYIEKPEKFDEMVKLAQKMCQNFNFVRVDLYYLDTNEIYFGEMTFTPSSGSMKWSSEFINKKLGDMIKLPKEAYNVDFCEYYKIPKPNKFLPYLLWPYYSYKINKMKKIYFDKLISNVISLLTNFRWDIKNYGDSENTFEIEANNLSIRKPKFMINEHGIGQVVHGSGLINKTKINIIRDGKLSISFRGQDNRFEGERFPVWIDYKSITIDGNEILSEPVATWHDKPFKYEMPVKDGQEIVLEVEQQYHEYTESELKDVLLKLNQDSDYIQNNIDTVVSVLKEQLPIISDETKKQREFEKCVSGIISEITPYRLDIKNLGSVNNNVEIYAESGNVAEPKWFSNAQGVGKILQGNNVTNIIKLKTRNDGILRIDFRGQDKRYNGERFPVWIDYKSIKINEKEVLIEPVATWHDKPFKYEMSVKDGQEVILKFEQQYHQYEDTELKEIIKKLGLVSVENLNDELIHEVYGKIIVQPEIKVA